MMGYANDAYYKARETTESAYAYVTWVANKLDPASYKGLNLSEALARIAGPDVINKLEKEELESAMATAWPESKELSELSMRTLRVFPPKPKEKRK
jgi:hypothetical protein